MTKKKDEIVISEWLIDNNYKGRIYLNRKTKRRRGVVSRRGRYWRTVKQTRPWKSPSTLGLKVTTTEVKKTEKLVKRRKK